MSDNKKTQIMKVLNALFDTKGAFFAFFVAKILFN